MSDTKSSNSDKSLSIVIYIISPSKSSRSGNSLWFDTKSASTGMSSFESYSDSGLRGTGLFLRIKNI